MGLSREGADGLLRGRRMVTLQGAMWQECGEAQWVAAVPALHSRSTAAEPRLDWAAPAHARDAGYRRVYSYKMLLSVRLQRHNKIVAGCDACVKSQ